VAIVASGSIADRPFGRTVAAIAQRRFTGTLTLGASSMGWRDGLVVSGLGTHPGDGAVKAALAAGLVTSSQASEIVSQLTPDSDDVARVGELGRLGTEQLARLRRRVVANRAMRLFAITTGDFVLDDVLADAPEIVPIDALVIIHHGVRAHYDQTRTLAELARLGDSFRLRVTVEDAIDAFGFGESEQATLAALALGPQTATALVEGSPTVEARVTLAALYALACGGYLDAFSAPTRPATATSPVVGAPRAHTSTVVPAPGAVVIRQWPPVSSARSTIVDRPRCPGAG
jgi:hypothetical protein